MQMKPGNLQIYTVSDIATLPATGAVPLLDANHRESLYERVTCANTFVVMKRSFSAREKSARVLVSGSQAAKTISDI
jgi:hypothetical protein